MGRFSPTVVDHFTSPRNCGRLPAADVAAFVGNPVCGDQILLTARVDQDAVSEVAFEAFGCSASLAIASILTERLAGMPIREIDGITTEQVLQWSGGLSPDQRHVAELGADVAHRLAGNYRNGLSDEGLSCGA
jgi:nitrogen fixation NifU-like protein